MAYQIFHLPKEAPALEGGWSVQFFLTGTTTETDTYTTSALSVAHTNPVEANAGGVLPVIYLDPSIVYKCSVFDADDVLQYTADPCNDKLVTQASVGEALYPRTAAEISAGVTPTNYAYPEGYVLRYGTNTTPGTTDMTAAIQAANDVMANYIGGRVVFPPQRLKTTATVTKSLGVSFIGAGRNATIIEAAHNNPIFTCINASQSNDHFAELSGFSLTNSGGSTPSRGIDYQKIVFSRVNDLQIASTITVGLYLEFVEFCEFKRHNNHAATGMQLISSSTADGTNANVFELISFSANATCQLEIDGHGSYQNHFLNCQFFSAPASALTLKHTYAAMTQFTNCTWENNVADTMQLIGGDGIYFKNCSFIDDENTLDSASFGARNVVFENCLPWVDSVQPPFPANDEITIRDSQLTLDEVGGFDDTDEALYLTEGHSTSGRQFAHFPGYAAAPAFAAVSHITPLGGPIPIAYNRVGSWNMADSGQWPTAGTSGATDPFGGTTAYTMAAGSSAHNGFSTTTAHTGRTFTFQVWANFVGRVRLAIGSTGTGVVKRVNFYSTKALWRLLSVTYTAGTDTDTTPTMGILCDQDTIMWRPCHYESPGPLPAISPGRDLAGITFPKMVEDTRIVALKSSTPTAGAWVAGDEIRYPAPSSGGARGEICTVSGSQGTWKTWGTLA